MSQTAYSIDPTAALAGMIADNSIKRIKSLRNAEAVNNLYFGQMISRPAAGADDDAHLIAAFDEQLMGIVVHTHAVDLIGLQTLATPDAVKPKNMFNCLEFGRVYVLPEQAVTPDNDVYVRVTANAAPNNVLGAFRKDSDGGRALLLKGGRWRSSGSATAHAILEFDGQAQNQRNESLEEEVEIPAGSASVVVPIFETKAGRHFKVQRITVIPETALATDAANYVTEDVEYGAGPIVLASMNTHTGDAAAAAMVQNTPYDIPLTGTAAQLILPPGTTLLARHTKTGTGAIPLTRFQVEGYYI